MIVRLITNPFSGDYSTLDIDVKNAGDIINCFQDPNIQIWQDNKRLYEDDELNPNSIVIIKRAPEATAIVGFLVFAITATILVVSGIELYKALTKTPKIGDIQTSPSLRGSSNQARKNQKLPILLGKHRIYPDIAALPYTSYKNNEQYLVQLFNFGYKDVTIDLDSVKIGDTALSKYTDYSLLPGLELYPERVIESSIQLELESNSIIRTTSSDTTKVSVGLSAPSGLYKFNDNGDKESITIGIKIEWAPKGTTSWTVAVNKNITANLKVWRESYEFSPTGDINGQYDIKVTRTTSIADDINIVDSIYFDVLRSILNNKVPSTIADDAKLYGLKLKATKQVNGIIDTINAEGQLMCRAYSGTGTGASAWTVQNTTNPASAILYLLTDKLANPRPVKDEQIEWAEFEQFYTFCKTKGFECSAWITSDNTISDLIDYIALSNLAQIRKANAKIGIILDNGQGSAVQLFTPHNASDFSEEINTKQQTKALKVKFVDKDTGYTEIERYVSLDDNYNVVFDEELDKEVDVTEITLFGVTSYEHASKVAKVRLLELARRNRTYKFKTDIEGLLCSVGDVVLLNHDSFLIGLGEGRVVDRTYSSGQLLGITLDNPITLSEGIDYGCSIRSAEGVYENIPIRIDSLNPVYIEFKQAINFNVNIDDIVAIGPHNSESIKILITSIERTEDYECTITAVDLVPEIYKDGIIPPFNSGLTIPAESEEIGVGIKQPIIYNAPVLQPSTYSNFEFAITNSATEPPITKETFFKYGDYYVQYAGSKIVIDDIWKQEQPVPTAGQFVWMRMLSKTGQYIVVRITGEIGEPAKQWSCVFNPSSYVNTPRRLNGFNIQILCESSNYENPVYSIELIDTTITDAERGYRLHPDYDNVIEILPGAMPPFVEINVTLVGAGGGTKILKCYGTESKESEPIYLGKVTSMPPSESDLGYRFIDGDWVFYVGTTTENYQYGHVYKKEGSSWIETSEFSKLQAVQDDAKSLMEDNVFAQVVFAQSILVTDMLVSGSFTFKRTDETTGKESTFLISKDSIIAKYDNQTNFEIDMPSGHVFIGEPNSEKTEPKTGFMFNPNGISLLKADLNIIDKNNREIYIGSNGILATDLNNNTIHDLPNNPITDGNKYLGHLLWFEDKSSYRLLDIVNFNINTWTTLQCNNGGNSNAKAGLFRIWINGFSTYNSTGENFNFIYLRPTGSGWGDGSDFTNNITNIPEGRLYIQSQSNMFSGNVSTYFLICPLSEDFKIDWRANAQPSFEYRKLRISQLGVFI